MKKLVSALSFFAISSVAVFANSHPADPTVATISAHCVITLPADQPLAEAYVIDVSALGFKSNEALQQFCENVGDRIIILRGDFANAKIYIQLYDGKDSTGNVWGVTEWNDYLAQRAPKMEALFNIVNQ